MQIQCAAALYGPKAQCSASLILNLQHCRGQEIESLEGRRLADGQCASITAAVRSRSILMSLSIAAAITKETDSDSSVSAGVSEAEEECFRCSTVELFVYFFQRCCNSRWLSLQSTTFAHTTVSCLIGILVG
jgi:hypothetical protein